MTSNSIIWRVGLLFAIGSVGWSLVQYFGGFLYKDTTATRLSFGVLPIFFMLFCIFLGIYKGRKTYRTADGEQTASFSQLLKIGMGITLIGAVFIAAYQVILSFYLEPDFLSKTANLVLEQQRLNPDTSSEKLQQLQEQMQKNATPFRQFNLSLVGNLFLGFFFSLTGSTLLKLSEKLR